MSNYTGRFEKLNDDIQKLATQVLQNQNLCKLIYYPDTDDIFTKPDIRGNQLIQDKKVILFNHKMPLVERGKTYLLIRPDNFRPSQGGHYIKCSLVFEAYSAEDIRNITYEKDGNIENGDRVILILNEIDNIMQNLNISIGENNFVSGGSIGNRDSAMTGYGVVYNDVDFRKLGG